MRTRSFGEWSGLMTTDLVNFMLFYYKAQKAAPHAFALEMTDDEWDELFREWREQHGYRTVPELNKEL